MMEWISQFHFLRPLWLLMLLPSLILVFMLLKQQQTQGNWTKVIAPALLPWLLEGEHKKPVRWPLMLALAGWVITCLAMAGPTWIKQPVPISKSQQPLVVAVDLSFNMYAADLSPNRLTRVRFKLQDLFNLRSEGLSALVAYAGSAHTVAPLTDDNRTLNNLVKALSPEVMPVQGILPNEINPVEAIRLAKELMTRGSNETGDILLVSGTITQAQAEQITDLLKDSPIRLSILGSGTEQGAPIPLPEGGYLKDKRGAIVVPQLEQERLQALARANGGRYQTMTLTDTDLKALVPAIIDQPLFSERESDDQTFDQWYDAGYWLVWLLLPLALFGFRRGWLMMIVVTLLPMTQEARAFSWNDLWQTRDQQGQQALQAGDPERAASLFSDPAWKSEALFQNQQFEEAASLLDSRQSENGSASNSYNRANALAKAGKLEEALKAYDQALSQQPDMEDAQFNRQLVKQLLDQRSRQEQQQDQQQNQQQNQQQTPSAQKQESGQNDNSNQKQQGDQNESNPQSQPRNNRQEDSAESPSENIQHQEDGNHSKEHNDSAEQKPEPNGSSNEQHQSEPPEASSETTPEKASEPAGPDEQNQTREQAGQGIAESQDDQPLSPEQQAVESWLRTIPDDPGGLLRRKFLQQQRALQQQNTREGASW